MNFMKLQLVLVGHFFPEENGHQMARLLTGGEKPSSAGSQLKPFLVLHVER